MLHEEIASFFLHLLDSSREADDGEEQTIHIEVLKHALDRVAINTEGDAGHAQIQTTADNIISSQSVRTG